MLHAFFKKHRFTLFAFVVLVLVQILSVQFMDNHYRRSDISKFKATYLAPFMTLLMIALFLFIFFYFKIYRKKRSDILKTFFSASVVFLIYTILLQDIIVGLLLGLNRCATTSTEMRTYVVVAQSPHVTVNALESYDVIIDQDFLSRHVRKDLSTLHVNDTLRLQIKKGIFGVVYY